METRTNKLARVILGNWDSVKFGTIKGVIITPVIMTKKFLLNLGSLIQRTIWQLDEKWRKSELRKAVYDERGDVPGWVLVVLMTTGLVTAIWTIAAPRLTAILKNSLDAMNGIR